MIVQETGGFHKSKIHMSLVKIFASSLVEGINRHKSLKNTLNSIVCMRVASAMGYTFTVAMGVIEV